MKPIKIHNQILDTTSSDYLILAGPTAVGKTDTVMSLAEAHDTEVVSGDSRQIYKYMNIGTATPDAEISPTTTKAGSLWKALRLFAFCSIFPAE